jgi:2-methylisocitrate lyase-like PEP mutase family enzyme
MNDKGHFLAVRLRKLIERPQGVFLFGVTMVPDAIVAQSAGHEGIYIGGYAFANASGYPDLGIYYGNEMLRHVQNFTDNEDLRIPALADADDCYGGVHNVKRVVRDLFEKTAVAAIHIEDQQPPKRCGHIAGKKVLPLKAAVGKISAAVAMRNSIDRARIIVARTDAAGAANSHGIADAIERAVAYIDAGADLVWCELASANSPGVVEFAEGVHKHYPGWPLAINISPSFKDWAECVLAPGDLTALGYKLPFSTYPSLKASVDAVHRTALEFKANYIDGIKKLEEKVAGGPARSIMELIGVDKYQSYERDFDPEAKVSQERSEGFRRLDDEKK